MIRVLLADNEQLLREGIRVILELQEDIEVVAEAADGVETLAMVEQHRPDLVLMDIQMPRLDGLTVTERLLGTADGHRPKILMLTSYDTDEYLFRAMKAGAGGFLLKDVPRDQLVHAVRTVAAGDELLAPVITRRLVEEFVRRPRARDDEALRALTERERAVLALVAQGRSNREIAQELFLGESTVKTHLGNVFAKCNLRDRAQAVVLAYETGLVRPGRSE